MPTFLKDNAAPIPVRIVGNNPTVSTKSVVPLIRVDNKSIPYEANIVPRSSTYKNFKILQTNCFAVIDNSYSGDADEWKLPVIAMDATVIHKNDRICQFRINKIQPEIEFEEVERLDETNRGGFGSTGRK